MRLKDLNIHADLVLGKIQEGKRTAQTAFKAISIGARQPSIPTRRTGKPDDTVRRPFPEETKRCAMILSYSPSFVDLLARVKGEELPKHQKKRFEEFWRTNLVGDIAI